MNQRDVSASHRGKPNDARNSSGQPVSWGHILKGFASSPEGRHVCRTRKLVSIRHRTDHDLLVLVSRELDRGLTLVAVATTRTSPLFAQAEKAYDTARAILPRISNLSEGDRRHLESRLKELRVRLDDVPTLRGWSVTRHRSHSKTQNRRSLVP